MIPENLRFGGGAADSTMHPLVVVYLLLAIVLILTLPRQKVIVPFLFAFFTVPVGQVLVLGGLHFTAVRILIIAGLIRRVRFGGASSNGKYPTGFNEVDWAVVLWSVAAAIAFGLEFPTQQALATNLGGLLDTLGGYLVVRSLISDGEAIRRAIKVLAVICVVLGVSMVNEQISKMNVFGLLGGIPVAVLVRNGSIRSNGTMGYIWAGAFAGALIPLFLWLWTEGKPRTLAIAGFAGATAMAFTSSSTTALMALGGSALGLAFWPLRKQMRIIRWAIVASLTGLHLVMKAPVWALIYRVDLTGSSSGYQRYQLVDMTIRHFRDWWLLGTPNYVNWGWDSWDLSNQFVAVALTGGLLTLILYLAIFTRSFRAIGTARQAVEGDTKQEWFLWCLGSALLGTVMAHFGINYPGQLIMGFFSLLACISVASFEAKQSVVRTEPTAAQEQLQPVPATPTAHRPLDEVQQGAWSGVSARRTEGFTS